MAQISIDDERLRRLLTITGVSTIVAIGPLAAIGAVERFPNPEKLLSYFGAEKTQLMGTRISRPAGCYC